MNCLPCTSRANDRTRTRAPGAIRGDVLVQLPQIGNALVPSIVFGEEAQLGFRAGRLPMAAVIVGEDGIAAVAESFGQSGVACGMLGPAVGDLYDRFRRTLGKPAIDVQPTESGVSSVKVVDCIER